MKVFVIGYNRLTYLREICEFLADHNLHVTILDNNSTYPPLLEWYANKCPYELVRFAENNNHFVLWNTGYINTFDDRHYAVTDPDLDLSKIPEDFMDVLMQGLWNNFDVIKSGLSLEINNLPDNPYAKEVYSWEKKFWETEQDNLGFYKSTIDTTFSIYDRERNFGTLPGGEISNNRFFSAVRSPRPYTALHRPWYLTKEEVEKNPEEKYFMEHSGGYWATKFKELL